MTVNDEARPGGNRAGHERSRRNTENSPGARPGAITLDIASAPRKESTSWCNGSKSWPDMRAYYANPQPIAKASAPLYLTGQLSMKRKTAEAVVSRSAITLDFDQLAPAASRAVLSRLDSLGVAALWHTTYQSTPESPRLRVLVPLSRPVNGAEYKDLAAALGGALGEPYDPASLKPEQASFAPIVPAAGPYEWGECEGTPLNAAVWLLDAQLAAPASQPERNAMASDDTEPTDRQRAVAAGALRRAVQLVREAPEGQRNNTLMREAVWVANYAAGGCLDWDDAEADLTAAALDAGLEPEESARTIASAWERGSCDPRRPAVDGAEDDFGPLSPEALEDLGAQVFDATPTMRHIRDAAHSRILSAWTLLAAVLAQVIARVPVTVFLPPIIGSRGSLNTLVALVGNSGMGKTQAMALAKELLHDDDAAELPLEISSPSGEGLTAAFLESFRDPITKVTTQQLKPYPHVLLIEDEVGNWEAIGARAGSSLFAMIRKTITGDTLTTTNAERERNRRVPAHSYRFSGLVGVQPGKSSVLLDDADAGTPQRVLWLPTTDRAIPDQEPAYPGPLPWALPEFQDPEHLVAVPEAVQTSLRVSHKARVRGDASDGLDGHAGLTRLKLAAALAFVHGETAISDQWWTLAGLIMRVSDATRATCQTALRERADAATSSAGRRDAVRDEARAATKAAENAKRAELVHKTVLRHADPGDVPNRKHRPAEGCTRRCLAGALRHHPAAVLEDVAATAVERGLIDERGGRWFPGMED